MLLAHASLQLNSLGKPPVSVDNSNTALVLGCMGTLRSTGTNSKRHRANEAQSNLFFPSKAKVAFPVPPLAVELESM